MSSPFATKTYAGSRRKGRIIAGIAAAIALGGLFQALNGSMFALIVAIAFSAFSLIFAFQAVRRLPTLSLDERGFEISTGFTAKRFSWAECYDFHVRYFIGPTTISFLRRGYGADNAILNQFNGGTAQICEDLDVWQKKYSAPPNESLARTPER